MTSGTGPRRRRRTEPAFDSYEGDWLTGLRPPADDREDEFDSPSAGPPTGPSTWTYPPPAPDDEPAPPWREQSRYEPPGHERPSWREPSPHGGPSGGGSAWGGPPRREPPPGPMPDEEPIFRRWDAAPSEPPPILQEQPMLRYMQESRVAPSTGDHSRRRRPAEPNGHSYGGSPDFGSGRGYGSEYDSDDSGPGYGGPGYGGPGYGGLGYGGPSYAPPGRVAPAPREPYPSREEYRPDVERDYRDGQHAGPPPGSVRPRRPDESGGMRAIRPDTTGSRPRISRSAIPDEPSTPSRGSGSSGSGGMRAVRPDTTGSHPRITAGGQSPVTTGSRPRISAAPASEAPTRGGGGGMRAVRPDTGEHPRITAAMAESRRARSESVSGPPSNGNYAVSRRGGAETSADAGRPHLSLMTMVGALVLLAVLGAAAFFLFRDNNSNKDGAQNTGVQSSAKPTPRDISNRQADSAPLTEAEVFPAPQVNGQPPYQVLKTQVSADCGTAAVDDLGRMLTDNGCNQVVRATLKSGDGAYLITAGIFNLADTQGALASHENIKPTIDAQKGRFTGLLAGQGTEALVRAPMILGWHARGHYLAYCIIARADGNGFEAGDERPNAVQTDILTTYLRDSVIGGRAQQRADASAPAGQPGQAQPSAQPSG